MQAFLPAFDSLLTRKYSIGTIDLKVQNKTAFQRELGWPCETKRPVICLPCGMSDTLGGELLLEVIPGILSLDVELLVLGKGSAKYGALFTKIAKEQNHRVHIVTEEERAVHMMYGAADMALFLSTAKEQEELDNALHYGVVPVAPPSPLLEDYNPAQETGNAFIAEAPTKWSVFAAIVRAMETHKFPFDWRTIQRHCMETAQTKIRHTA